MKQLDTFHLRTPQMVRSSNLKRGALNQVLGFNARIFEPKTAKSIAGYGYEHLRCME